jgi:hypothetical protein
MPQRCTTPRRPTGHTLVIRSADAAVGSVEACGRSYADGLGGDAVLADSYGRVATDLRVSLTDRCNLRCEYCMPAEGLDWLPRPELLTDDEVARLIRIGVELLGITEIRFTGGSWRAPRPCGRARSCR